MAVRGPASDAGNARPIDTLRLPGPPLTDDAGETIWLSAEDPDVLDFLRWEADERAWALGTWDSPTDTSPVRTHEEWVRRLLHKLGFRGVRLRPGSKKRLRQGKQTQMLPLAGESWGVVPPPGYVIIDPDSELGQRLVEELKLPPTLTIRTSKGRHLYFRLPPGVTLPKRQLRLLTDVDLIVGCGGSYVVAPGSRVGGNYYAVEQALPIAELPLVTAQGLADFATESAAKPEPPRESYSIINEGLNWDRVARNRKLAHQARGTRKARKPSRDPGADLQEWLHETRDGYRHQAMLKVALRRTGDGWSYEQYEAEIQTHPLRCKLDGQSPDWLCRYVWAKAQQLYKPPTWKDAPSRAWRRAWRRHGAGIVQRWLHGAVRHVPDGQLRKLLKLFADWAERFGPHFYLCQGLMKFETGLRENDWKKIRELIDELKALDLITEYPRDDLPKWQATYFDLKHIDLADIDPNADGIGALAHGSDLQLRSETEIDRLLYLYGGYEAGSFSGATEFEGSAGGLAAA